MLFYLTALTFRIWEQAVQFYIEIMINTCSDLVSFLLAILTGQKI